MRESEEEIMVYIGGGLMKKRVGDGDEVWGDEWIFSIRLWCANVGVFILFGVIVIGI